MRAFKELADRMVDVFQKYENGRRYDAHSVCRCVFFQ